MFPSPASRSGGDAVSGHAPDRLAFDAEDPEECDPGWLATFLTELRASLLEAGIEELPILSYLFESNLEQIREAIGSVQAR